MKLKDLYKMAVEIGIENDLRSKKDISRILKDENQNFNSLKDEEKEFYDKDRMFNPYADSRILYGDHDQEIKKVITGIDMEVGEILLAYQLNKELKGKIDLVIAHHPEGYALAQKAKCFFGTFISLISQCD